MKNQFVFSGSKDQDVQLYIESVFKNIGSLYVKDAASYGISGFDDIVQYDIDDCVADLHEFLNMYQDKFQDFKEFSFRPTSVYEEITQDEGNHLRYSIDKRTPGTMSQQNQPHEGHLAMKWEILDILDDKLNPGYKCVVYVKPFDNSITLYSCSKNFRDADKAAFKLEEILDTYMYVFKQHGADRFQYFGRGSTMRQEMHNIIQYFIPLKFYIRTNAIKLVYEKSIENIAIEAVLKKQIQ